MSSPAAAPVRVRDTDGPAVLQHGAMSGTGRVSPSGRSPALSRPFPASGAAKGHGCRPSGEKASLRFLHEQQCEQAGYRFPWREEEAACLPDYARERILRLMLDLCAQRHDGTRARGLTASLPANHFTNVEDALLHTAERDA